VARLDVVNPRIEADPSFVFPRSPATWEGPLRAAVSSFGMSGTNAHVVLAGPEDAPAAAADVGAPFLLSASSPEALRALAVAVAAWLRARPDAAADAAWTLAVRRQHLAYRLAADDADGLDAFGAAPATGRFAEEARRHVAGETVDWAALLGPGRVLADLPAYPWQRKRAWVGDPNEVEVAPASTDVAEVVAGLVARALGLDALDADERFEEVGLDSLLLVDVVARLEKELGRALPATDVWKAGTARRVAALVRGETSAPTGPGAWWVPLSGPAARTLYCLPWAGGGPSVFRELARALAPRGVQVVAAQLPGREGRLGEPVATDARAVVDALRAGMTGRFAVYGHSLGARVACALAGGAERLFVGASPAPDVAVDVRDTLRVLEAQLTTDPALRPLARQLLAADLALLPDLPLPTRLPPVLCLAGDADPLVPVAACHGWRAHGVVEVLAGADHFFCRDRADLLAARIADALSTVS
jgi:surfactin synthase thioesterase subunit/acyl carrier protein